MRFGYALKTKNLENLSFMTQDIVRIKYILTLEGALLERGRFAGHEETPCICSEETRSLSGGREYNGPQQPSTVSNVIVGVILAEVVHILAQ